MNYWNELHKAPIFTKQLLAILPYLPLKKNQQQQPLQQQHILHITLAFHSLRLVD
jgi:hypothetical protein